MQTLLDAQLAFVARVQDLVERRLEAAPETTRPLPSRSRWLLLRQVKADPKPNPSASASPIPILTSTRTLYLTLTLTLTPTVTLTTYPGAHPRAFPSGRPAGAHAPILTRQCLGAPGELEWQCLLGSECDGAAEPECSQPTACRVRVSETFCMGASLWALRGVSVATY